MVGLLIPKMSAIFTETGDLFTAVYLAWNEQGVKVIDVMLFVCVCVCMQAPASVCVCMCNV